MPLKDKETPKPMEQALEIMNELTGWDSIGKGGEPAGERKQKG